MSLRQDKIDVTDRVTAKLNDGEIQLFLEGAPIGKIRLPENIQYELDHHFEEDTQKIYQHVTTTHHPDAKYTDCDDGGWC
ncbi:YusG family protein [Pseudoneobacillus sp. C159]